MPIIFLVVVTYTQTVNVAFMNYSCLFLHTGSGRPLLGLIFVAICSNLLHGLERKKLSISDNSSNFSSNSSWSFFQLFRVNEILLFFGKVNVSTYEFA